MTAKYQDRPRDMSLGLYLPQTKLDISYMTYITELLHLSTWIRARPNQYNII